jgi:hypothetical protein
MAINVLIEKLLADATTVPWMNSPVITGENTATGICWEGKVILMGIRALTRITTQRIYAKFG